MSVPSLKSLVAELDVETHGGRVRRVALLGRDEAGSPRLAELLDGMTSMGGYWSRLALEAAFTAGDNDRLVAALSSSYGPARRFALRRLVVTASRIDELVATYPTLSTVERLDLARLIGRSGPPDLCERLATICRESNREKEAARFLPGCTSTFVAAALPELDHVASNWSVLGRKHPTEFLNYLEAKIGVATRSRRDAIWHATAAGVRACCERDPDRILDLLETAGPRSSPSTVLVEKLGLFVRQFPSRITHLLLASQHLPSIVRAGPPRAVLVNARALPAEERLSWAKALRDSPQQLAVFLDRLAPSDRAEVFSAVYDDIDTTTRVWPDALLEVLPHAVRRAETQRMLTVRPIIDDPVRHLATTSFLPITEARRTLNDALGAAQAEDRAIAYSLLINCTRRSRSQDELGITLTMLRRLRNEQDPVRLAACTALAAMPAHLFADVHLDDVGVLVDSVVEARDSSPATVNHLRRLILALVVDLRADSPRERLAGILGALDRLAGPAGTMSFAQIGRQLRRGAEQSLLAALQARLVEDAKRDRFDLTISLASGLGQRAWALNELQELLRRATKAPLDTIVRRAIDLWLAPPKTRADRVGQLVASDASTLTLNSVLRVVIRQRQDLLDVLLRAKPAKGRFLSGNVRHVPIIIDGLSGWLPRQHTAYADALLQLIRDSAAKPWVRSSAIRALARIPQVGSERIMPFLDSPAVDMVEAALAGLSWSDEPDRQLERLLGYADTDRARVAVYAASRCARFTRPGHLGQVLTAVLESPTAKVTARKEAIRLLAQHQPPGALGFLLHVGGQDNVHRDIRIAIGRSIRYFLDDPRSWEFLSTQVDGTADETRALLETVPANIANRHRSNFGQLVARATSHEDQRTKTLAFNALSSWSPWLPSAAQLAADNVENLDSGGSWQPALTCLISIFADGVTTSTADLILRLATRNDDDLLDAAAQRDRPSRQRLVAIVDHLVALDSTTRELLQQNIRECSANLTGIPTCTGLEISLLLSATDLGQPGEVLAGLAGRFDDRPIAATNAAAHLARTLHRDQARWTPNDLAAPTDELMTSGGLAASLLAIELIRAAGPRSGWSPEWRDRLRNHRQSDVPDVVAFALNIVTASESG